MSTPVMDRPMGTYADQLRVLFPHVEQPAWCEHCEIELAPGVVDHHGRLFDYETPDFCANAVLCQSTGRSSDEAQVRVAFAIYYDGSQTDAYLPLDEFRQLVAQFNGVLAQADAQGGGNDDNAA